MENGVLLQGFHWYIKPEEKLWKQLQGKVKSYKEMGFSAIWLPPAYKGVGGINDNGYGVYDLYDRFIRNSEMVLWSDRNDLRCCIDSGRGN